MKVLIVDDHAIVREGLTALLVQAEPGAEILQASGSLDALEVLTANADLDVIVLDLTMPGMDGMWALPAFYRLRPGLPVIVLSSSENPDDVRNALAAGAMGYVTKSASPRTLVAAVRLVLAGSIYVPPLMAAPGQRPQPASEPPTDGPLTARHKDVLELLAAGKSNKEIGLALGIAEKTVKAHVTAIFRSLNVVNRTQAAMRLAERAGTLPPR
jgi:DNA-binding NarL/FixJ family response regulator